MRWVTLGSGGRPSMTAIGRNATASTQYTESRADPAGTGSAGASDGAAGLGSGTLGAGISTLRPQRMHWIVSPAMVSLTATFLPHLQDTCIAGSSGPARPWPVQRLADDAGELVRTERLADESHRLFVITLVEVLGRV